MIAPICRQIYLLTCTSTSPILARQHLSHHYAPHYCKRLLLCLQRSAATTARLAWGRHDARLPARAALIARRRRQLGARGLRTRRRLGESSKPCVDVAMLSSPKGGRVPAPRVDGDLSAGCRNPHLTRRAHAEDLWLCNEMPHPAMCPNVPDVPSLSSREVLGRWEWEAAGAAARVWVVGSIAGRSRVYITS